MTTSSSSKAPANDEPWKHTGYRDFTNFVVSDNDFFVLRRFSNLTARVLLALQDELSQQENQLHTLEDRICDSLAPEVHNGSFRYDTSEERSELIREIGRKLRAYSELLEKTAHQLRTLIASR